MRHAVYPVLQLRAWQLVERQADHGPQCLGVGEMCQWLQASQGHRGPVMSLAEKSNPEPQTILMHGEGAQQRRLVASVPKLTAVSAAAAFVICR